MKDMTFLLAVLLLTLHSGMASSQLNSPAKSEHSKEYHVSVLGDDANDGTYEHMLRTISAAAERALPGDIVTVHEGVYRERVNPPRGGNSDAERIEYRAAPDEVVEIRGSEEVSNWEPVQNDAWKTTLPNEFFGDYNPYGDLIHGDWFSPKGREHHTGAVYLNGEWLIEAASLEEVLQPAGTVPAWLQAAGREYLLNVAWLQPNTEATAANRIPATAFSEKNGTQNAPCEEGGECIGFIQHGHWVKYEGVHFEAQTELMEIRAASAGNGGIIEIRLDAPDGELLGACSVPNTGGWQSWTTFKVKIKPVPGNRNLCLTFKSATPKPDKTNVQLWYARADDQETTIWAQFPGVNPNEEHVEINVRRAVFYPDQPGRNYITVRGFRMRHAATQWAPPTSEQVGLIGTHWSKGWIIENNEISHSICSGIALGKHGDEHDNTSADTAEGYVQTIDRAIKQGWSKENIGHHTVRNNVISHCEQTGIVGSLGAIFSTITGNVIHDIHVRELFTGAEMAGIKLHAAIDVEIFGNHIYRTCRGLWLDWMAQGARVSGNLFHDNSYEDLFVEVNHGPFVVDNNLFLSKVSILTLSRGGAFAHNLMAGDVRVHHYDSRMTPFHKAHSAEIAGMHDNPSGDDRYYNNLLVNRGSLAGYDEARLPVSMEGNVFLNGARASKHESAPLIQQDFNPQFALIEKEDGLYFEGRLDKDWVKGRARKLVSTEILGKTVVSNLPYENRDGSSLAITRDYLNKNRNENNPYPGPFEIVDAEEIDVKVWPILHQ